MSSAENPLPWSEVFSGRAAELRQLADAWERVQYPQPDPQVVVLLAESGLGKTRLVQEFFARISAEQGADEETSY